MVVNSTRLVASGLALGLATVLTSSSTGPAQASAPASASAPVPGVRSATTAPVDPASQLHQLDVRKRFGLNTDPQFIASLSGTADSVSLGIPMTASEAQQFADRNVAGLHIQTIDQTESARNGGTYAGAWLDNSVGGVLVINTTDPPSIDLSHIQSLLPSDIRARVQKVAVSSAQLADLHNRIAADASSLPALEGAGYGTLTEGNQEVIYLGHQATQNDVDALYARYGRVGLHINLGGGSKLFADSEPK